MSASAAILREQLADLPDGLRRPAGILVGDVARLRDLVLELLELARLDAGEEAPRIEPLRLRAAVASVVRSDGEGRTFDLDVPADIVVLADPTRLRRILSNLVTNAIRHGHGAVRVAAELDGDDVLLHVTDDGPGLAPGEEERIFDRFFKSEQSRAAGGSGLGLAIARTHARSLGGDLVAANDPGHGARFTLRLPLGGPTGTEEEAAPDRRTGPDEVVEQRAAAARGAGRPDS